MAKNKKNSPHSKAVSVILTLIEIICIGVAVFAGYKIYDSWRQNKKSDETFEKLSNEVVSTATPDSSSSAAAGRVIDWDALLQINNNAAAWIYQEGTGIDYPVVYAPDNDYYLRRDINQNYSIWGVPFIDYNNHHGFIDKNTVIYGHSGTNTTQMFSTLDNYREQSYYDQHKELDLYTPAVHYKLYPIAGYETTAEDAYVMMDFPSDEAFMEYVNGFIAKSMFRSEQTVQASDQTVLLSTCQFHQTDGRFALLCKLVKLE